MTRPAVAWFAEQMEQKLQANDHKPDWERVDRDELDWLFIRLLEEALELHKAALYAGQGPWTKKDVVEEAADVANFAMMIADKVTGMFTQRGRQER